MSNWRRDKEFVENFMNHNRVSFEIMPKTKSVTWKQIKEDIGKKLLIEENYNIIEENENLILENANLILENKRMQNEIQNYNFEKIIIFITLVILFMIIMFLRA